MAISPLQLAAIKKLAGAIDDDSNILSLPPAPVNPDNPPDTGTAAPSTPLYADTYTPPAASNVPKMVEPAPITSTPAPMDPITQAILDGTMTPEQGRVARANQQVARGNLTPTQGEAASKEVLQPPGVVPIDQKSPTPSASAPAPVPVAKPAMTGGPASLPPPNGGWMSEDEYSQLRDDLRNGKITPDKFRELTYLRPRNPQIGRYAAQGRKTTDVYGDEADTYAADALAEQLQGKIVGQTAAQSAGAHQEYEKGVADLDAAQKEHDVRMNNAQTLFTNQQNDLQKRMNNLPGIDPQHWMRSGGAARQVLAGLAVGLGALGASLPHTVNHVNYGLEIINKAMEQDVDAQKTNLEKTWKALVAQGDMQATQLGMAKWVYTQQTQEKDFKLKSLGALLQNKLQQFQQEGASQSAIAATQLMIDKTRREAAANKLEGLNNSYTWSEKQRQYDLAQAGAANALHLKMVDSYSKYFAKQMDDNAAAVRDGKPTTPIIPFSEFAKGASGMGYTPTGAAPNAGAGLPTYKSYADIPQKDQNKAVRDTETGTWTILPSEAFAKDYAVRKPALVQFQNDTNKLKALTDKVKGQGGVMTPNDVAEYNSLRTNLTFGFPQVHSGVGRQPNIADKDDFQKNVMPEVPVLSDNWASYIFGGGMDATVKNLQDIAANGQKALDSITGQGNPTTTPNLPPGATERK